MFTSIQKTSQDERFFVWVIGVVIRFRSNLLYQKFVRISTQSHIRALKRLCAKHRAFPKEKDGMCEYKCGLGFAKLFSGERIRKTETNIFEIRKGFWISPPRRRGLGRNPRGLSFGFFGGAGIKKKTHILKSRQSQDTTFVLCLTHPPVRAQIAPKKLFFL